MKKLILGTALAFASMVSAQKSDFGLKGGLNTSFIKGDMGAGIYLGGVARFKINEKFSFQPELLYAYNNGNYNTSGKGVMQTYLNAPYNVAIDAISYNYSYQHQISYHSLSVPLMLAYQINKKLSVLAGLQLNVILSNKNITKMVLSNMITNDGLVIEGASGTAQFSFEDKKINIKDRTSSSMMDADFKPKTISLGLNLGAAYDVNPNFFLEGRLSIGLTNFVDNANVLATSYNQNVVIPNQPVANTTVTLDKNSRNIGLSNTNLQLGVGYRF